MHTSGLVLDVYDDVDGGQLKSFFTTRDELPDFVKAAHAITPGQYDTLPDDAFALVLVNDGERLRKFACIDEGNTALSILYFVKNAHKLPVEAAVRAAENLKVACAWYDLAVPEEVEKIAVSLKGLGEAAQVVGSNVKGLGGTALGAGRAALETAASPLISADLDPTPSAGTIKKTSSLARLVEGHRGETSVEPEVGAGVAGKAPERAPQHMNPVVDVSTKERPVHGTEKKASRFALPTYGKYPLDSYAQVKEASAYFEVFGKQMDPVDRHEYCVNLVKRAEELSVTLGDDARKYGSIKYASAHELQVAFDTRAQLLDNAEDRAVLTKVASQIGTMDPSDFCALLGAFDESRGLHHHYDSHVMDPYYSTFGFQKQAAEDESWSDVVGNYHITKHELDTFALNHWMQLKKIFGMDFAEEFKKDPIGIYSSMPVEQKKLIIRMATENSPV